MQLFQFVYYALIASVVQIVAQVYALPSEDILLKPNREHYAARAENYLENSSSCVEMACSAGMLGQRVTANGMQAGPPNEKGKKPLILTEDIPLHSTPSPTIRDSDPAQDTTESVKQEVKPLHENSLLTEPNVTALPLQVIEHGEPSTKHSETIQDKVNEYRLQYGKKPLNEEPRLCEAAQIRAQAASANFSHEGFEETVKTIAFERVAENLWQGEPFDLDTMIQSWNMSSGHRDNMLGDWSDGCGRKSGNTVAFIFLGSY